MKNQIKSILRPFYSPVLKSIRSRRKNNYKRIETAYVKKLISNRHPNESFVFYLGVTAHSNLGDMAQYFCIRNWILKNYSEKTLVEIEADTIVDTRYDLLNIIKDNFNDNDRIIFQSGYTTQDLGGVHDLMHRMVITTLPEAKILMMPQTVFFQHMENQKESGRIYNQGHNMLFLARDQVSYGTALSMLPDVKVLCYPDIVTSLIGKYEFNNVRKGVCLCRRNDGEKYYAESELLKLVERLKQTTSVDINDTTIKLPHSIVRTKGMDYIENQIKDFSKYEVVITDRYHGTIFSLIAGTPVIIIKTTDHKVITGADWFKGVYDDSVFVAKDLDDAFNIAKSIMIKGKNHHNNDYFDTEYYSKLKDVFEIY